MSGTVVARAAGAAWEPRLRGFFAYRDLGVRAASGGAFGAHIIRAVPGEASPGEWHSHDLAFQMVLVLRGAVRFEYADLGEVELRPGDSVYQPPGIRHREVWHSDDLELLEVTAPAEFLTHAAAPLDQGAGRG
jgi:mannose-6-phosphate isomerase-like protein (cupin superfamily)